MAVRLAELVGPALGPMGPGVDPGVGIGSGLLGSAIGAFLTTLIVGGIMVAIAPEYTARMMDAVSADPVNSFVYGIVVVVALVILTILLAITIVGILLAIPLVLITLVVWAVGAAIGYLTIGDRLVGRGDGWAKPLVVGAAINGALALTGIGGIVAFAIGATGFGAILRDSL